MKFFVLKKRPEAGEIPAVTECVYVDGSPMGEAPRCPACGAFIGALPLLPTIRVELETWGNEFGDLAFGWGGDELLLRDRFWKLYQHSGLTGLIDIGPVEMAKLKSHRKLREPAPRYYCCRVGRS